MCVLSLKTIMSSVLLCHWTVQAQTDNITILPGQTMPTFSQRLYRLSTIWPVCWALCECRGSVMKPAPSVVVTTALIAVWLPDKKDALCANRLFCWQKGHLTNSGNGLSFYQKDKRCWLQCGRRRIENMAWNLLDCMWLLSMHASLIV